MDLLGAKGFPPDQAGAHTARVKVHFEKCDCGRDVNQHMSLMLPQCVMSIRAEQHRNRRHQDLLMQRGYSVRNQEGVTYQQLMALVVSHFCTVAYTTDPANPLLGELQNLIRVDFSVPAIEPKITEQIPTSLPKVLFKEFIAQSSLTEEQKKKFNEYADTSTPAISGKAALDKKLDDLKRSLLYPKSGKALHAHTIALKAAYNYINPEGVVLPAPDLQTALDDLWRMPYDSTRSAGISHLPQAYGKRTKKEDESAVIYELAPLLMAIETNLIEGKTMEEALALFSEGIGKVTAAVTPKLETNVNKLRLFYIVDHVHYLIASYLKPVNDYIQAYRGLRSGDHQAFQGGIRLATALGCDANYNETYDSYSQTDASGKDLGTQPEAIQAAYSLIATLYESESFKGKAFQVLIAWLIDNTVYHYLSFRDSWWLLIGSNFSGDKNTTLLNVFDIMIAYFAYLANLGYTPNEIVKIHFAVSGDDCVFPQNDSMRQRGHNFAEMYAYMKTHYSIDFKPENTNEHKSLFSYYHRGEYYEVNTETKGMKHLQHYLLRGHPTQKIAMPTRVRPVGRIVQKMCQSTQSNDNFTIENHVRRLAALVISFGASSIPEHNLLVAFLKYVLDKYDMENDLDSQEARDKLQPLGMELGVSIVDILNDPVALRQKYDAAPVLVKLLHTNQVNRQLHSKRFTKHRDCTCCPDDKYENFDDIH